MNQLSFLARTVLVSFIVLSPQLKADVTIGGDRPTTLHVPASYDPQVPAPLLFLLHGCPSDGAGPYGENVLKLGPLADELGILFAAPDGSGSPGQRSWGSCFGSFEVSSAYLRSLIEEAQSLFNVDRSRVYLAGYSDGGVMSYRMACDHPDIVSAVAFLAGANLSACKPTVLIPVLDVHGTADANVTYAAGLDGITNFFWDAAWAMDQEEAGEGPEIVRGVATTVSRWGVGCLPDGFVEHWSLPGVNHFPILMADGATTALSRHMVDWLLRHPRGPVPTAVATVEPVRGMAPLQVTADASRSTAPDGAPIRSYCWSFGDGQASTGVVAAHTYEVPGQRVVRLLAVSEEDAVSARVEQEVTVTCPTGDLGNWTATDIGTLAFPGAARFEDGPESGDLLLCSAGTGLVGLRDRLLFVHRRIDGDFRLTLRISELLVDGAGGFAGAMCRESLSETSRCAGTVLHFTNGALVQSGIFRFRSRQDEGAFFRGTSGEELLEPTGWVRLERRGNTFVGETSTDGLTWSRLAEQVIEAAPHSMLVGVAAARWTTVAAEFDALRARVHVELEDRPDTLFHRGDPNSSGATDLSDAIATFGFLFLGDPEALSCRESADANNDGMIDISDGIYLLSWLFTGGPEPAAPGPPPTACGFDTDAPGSPGDLGCSDYAQCN